MTTARELMTPGAECVGEKESLVDAARKMRDLDVGALPICGEDNRLKGVLTDRDIVVKGGGTARASGVKGLAGGGDPSKTTAGSLGQGKPVTIGADDSIEEALRTMGPHQGRRLPVIDGHELVGMLAQADVVQAAPGRAGRTVSEISEPH